MADLSRIGGEGPVSLAHQGSRRDPRADLFGIKPVDGERRRERIEALWKALSPKPRGPAVLSSGA